tara:strand:+ start:146 stop:1177 length:1032 start_codon:yes stop_codon:yes gene_type:complete
MKSKSPFPQRPPLSGNPTTPTDPKSGNVFDFADKETRPYRTNITDEEYKAARLAESVQKSREAVFGKDRFDAIQPPTQPSSNYIQKAKYPITTFRRPHISSDNEPDYISYSSEQTHDIREKYLKTDAPYAPGKAPVDFESAEQDDYSKQFLARYNHPVTRKRLKEQAGLTNADTDNFILTGLTAHKEDTNKLGSDILGSYTKRGHKILMRPENKYYHPDYQSTETHERVHASKLDNLLGKNLQDVLGNSWHQKTKNYHSKVKTYLNKPHEAYGNFAGFREQIKLKPGEQIDVKELKKRVKEAGQQNSNFYMTYDDDKIVKALNTIASNDSSSGKSWANKHRTA